jgi:hypothetical protein
MKVLGGSEAVVKQRASTIVEAELSRDPMKARRDISSPACSSEPSLIMSTEAVGSEASASERSVSRAALHRAWSTVARGAAGVSFWLAVALPFAYLPLLATGIETGDGLTTLGGLLAANAVALLVGHTHRRD